MVDVVFVRACDADGVGILGMTTFLGGAAVSFANVALAFAIAAV